MFTAKTWFFAPSLGEAYETLQKNRANTIAAGCGWLKMTNKKIWTAIDLSRLGLDTITETGKEVQIGAMVTLRQLETDPRLAKLFGGILPQAVRSIVGVQFRNGATVGASVFSRFGFSDLLTALLALDTTVVLYGAGEIPLTEFVKMPYQRDILSHIRIKKDKRSASFETLRLSATDFPVLAVAVSRSLDGKHIVSVGARPARAARAVKTAAFLDAAAFEKAEQALTSELSFGSNQRATASYRCAIAPVLLGRAFQSLTKAEGGKK